MTIEPNERQAPLHRFRIPRAYLVPMAVSGAMSLWTCSPDVPAPAADSSRVTVAAPEVDDPVTDWELQYLPAIDAHMKAGRLDSVVVVCRLGLAQDSTRIVLYNLMASAYAEQGLHGAAAEALRTAVRLSPEFTAGWVNLGGMHARLGRFEEALPYLQRAAELAAEDPATHRRLAEAFAATGQHEKSVSAVQTALALLPGDASLTLRLGAAQQALGRQHEALVSFLQAGRLDPGYLEAHMGAADLAHELGQPALADSCLAVRSHLLQLAEGDTTALQTMAQLRKGLENAPEQPIHHARLGGFFLYHDYVPQALALFERARHLAPTDVWLLNEFGGLLSRTGHGAESLEYYEQALQVDPTFGPALINTGGVLNALGRHEEALARFDQALSGAPDDPGIRFFLGATYISLGRHDEAREQLQQALEEIDDNHESLKQQIEGALASLPE